MSPEEIEAIRERERAATPGPWQPTPNLTGVPNGVDICLDPCVIAIVHSDAEPPNLAADTAFIAAAREDVPALLAEIEALKREWDLTDSQWKERCEEAEAEIARLRAAAEPRCTKGNVLAWHTQPCESGCNYPAPAVQEGR